MCVCVFWGGTVDQNMLGNTLTQKTFCFDPPPPQQRTFGAVQVRLWPWRTTLANYTDLAITFILQVVLLGIAPLLEVEEGVSTESLCRITGRLFTEVEVSDEPF